MNTNLNTVENGSEVAVANNVPAWKREGLPGMPIWAVERRCLTESARLVRDGNGKTILYEKSNSESLRTALICRLGRSVRTVLFVTDIVAYERHPGSIAQNSKFISPVVAFATDSDAPLSVVERIEAKVVADLFTNYAFINPVSESYRLPRIFAEYRRDWPENAWSVPAKVVSEEKALQIAQVAEYILGTEAEIISETDGYFSVVIPHTARVAQGDAMLRLSHAIDLLDHFNVVAGDHGIIHSIKDEQEMYDRSLYGAEVYMAQKRIEDGINAILAHLGHSEVTGKGNVPVTEQSPATPPKRRGIESLIPSGKPSKKSSAKSA